MRRLAEIALAAGFALAGCSLVNGARSTALPGLRMPAATPSLPTADGDGSPTRHIVREQLQSLIGKSPDEAKALLRGYGHDGEVKVAPGAHHVADCKMDRVCGFDVPESGMGAHDGITLFVNPALKIAAPPP